MPTIEDAIKFSTSGEHNKALEIFLRLLDENHIETAQHFMELAFALDRDGKEHEAIPHYTHALNGNLSEHDKLHVYFCLASSYRAVGELKQAQTILIKAVCEYPEEASLQILQALVEYDCGNTTKSIGSFLSIAEKHITQENLAPYKWLLRREAAALNDRSE